MEYKDRLAHAMYEIKKLPKRGGATMLADAIGISSSAIGMVLSHSAEKRGIQTLGAAHTERAARWLGVDPFWLATGEGEAQPLLFLERQRLSTEAVAHALLFDALDSGQREVWSALVLLARQHGAATAAEKLVQSLRLIQTDEGRVGGAQPASQITNEVKPASGYAGVTKEPSRKPGPSVSLPKKDRGYGSKTNQRASRAKGGRRT